MIYHIMQYETDAVHTLYYTPQLHLSICIPDNQISHKIHLSS